MAFYVFRPKPDDVAKESLQHFRQLERIARAEMEYAQRSEEATIDRYEESATNQWEWGTVLQRVADRVAALTKTHAGLVKRLAWEEKCEWAKKFPKRPFSMPTPWLTNQKEWLKCFELGPEDKI
jgi:hypothetical protein